jgi:hypothetical protein
MDAPRQRTSLEDAVTARGDRDDEGVEGLPDAVAGAARD